MHKDKRILAIGDIHGEYDKFLNLYGKIGFNPPDDLLVFLGDYVDRGPKPVPVLGWMLKNRRNPHIVMLRGNHDQMMLDHYERKERERLLAEGELLANCLDDLAAAQAAGGGPEESAAASSAGGDWDIWIANGGGVTMKELKRFSARLAETRGIPERTTMKTYLDFLAGLPLSHTVRAGGRTFFFCHAGVLPGIPLEDQPEESLLWIREEFYAEYKGEAVVVVGHTPVEDVRLVLEMEPADFPVILPNRILVDTGACCGRPLSCVDVLSGRVWQSD